ncbi:CHAD domain protein [Corynebacterium atrinae]|uniref:CYTH and CHAD domain-containing protein n=1 Tax=Corynebacterium atrinae TaxID=1336740 RepID=UPI0025B39FBD|nr:CYTH and CHAD domain-containing protein [Corynebacterium atrinae]WJY63885.1 CHAD domain protein [Corynebacterium atrinae]
MSTRAFLEVEAKFAVADNATCPDLTQIEGVKSVMATAHHQLSAIYYDTDDLRLTRSKITLRRREGGSDDGWHIKFPGSAGRLEVHAPLGEPIDGILRIPEELRDQVRALVRNNELKPIAQVDNHRTEITLGGEGGAPVAEFCDDHVSAWSLLPGGDNTTWREWEVELSGDVAGTDTAADIMPSATSLLISAGAKVSSSPSKLVMALGTSEAAAPLPTFFIDADLPANSPTAAVIAALKLNRDKLLEFDPKVRRNEWDSVHQMRVATRELRSHLETFDDILASDKIGHIEEELKLLARMLGHARDAEVVEERFLRLLDSEDSGVLDEATRQHLREDMGSEYRRAHRRVVATLNSERYLNLLDAIDDLLAHPPAIGAPALQTPPVDPVTEADAEEDLDMIAEGGPGEPILPVFTDGFDPEEDTEEEEEDMIAEGAPSTDSDSHPAADRTPLEVEAILSEHLDLAYRKLIKRHHKAIENWENPELSLHEREVFFHDMRKSAKKVRYAAEAVGAATNLKTKRLYNACKAMQASLGDFQDSVTSRDRLVKMAEQARRRGEDTFGYGLLYQRERTLGLRALEAYTQEVKAIKAAYARLLKSAEKSAKQAAKQASKQAKKKGKKK